MAGAPHLEAFIDAAWYFVGMEEDGDNSFSDPRGQEMWDLFGYDASGTSWCAIFISACAEKAGIGNVLIYKTSGAGWLQEATCLYYGGEWIEGPYMNGGNPVVPAPGDILSLGNDDYHGYGHAYHVGIVIDTDGGQVHTIEGNAADQCKERWYSFDDSRINMYVRPDWARVGDDASEYTAGASSGSYDDDDEEYEDGEGKYVPLYTIRNDRHDMTLREVCYMNSGYDLTNSQTSISISIMNFTSFLADLYDFLGIGNRGTGKKKKKSKQTKINVDTSGLSDIDENVKVTVDYLYANGYSISAACGIAGALYSYSRLNVAYYKEMASGVTVEGIGGWEPDEFQELRDRAGYDGKYTLSGQLDYLVYDLETNYEELVEDIKYADYGSTQAEYVAKEVIWHYNNHFRHSDYEKAAKENAKEFYDALTFTQTNSYAGGKDIRDIDGIQLEPKFTVDVPSDVPQAGIDGNFTSYSYWYHRWAAGTKQRELADNWAYQGYPYDRGSIALIGGYYCFGMAENTFGDVGDIVVVYLENGDSFAGILADVKYTGDSNYCEWGHYYENGTVNMVEWERICTYNGEVQTEGSSYNIVDGIELGSWAGQNIVRVVNYGSYL